MSFQSLVQLQHEDILHEMECPVCRDYMHPPIRQCMAGHSFCSQCFLKLRACATCRQSLSVAARSYALERIHAKLSFPCRNREEGCPTVLQGVRILDHQEICTFAVIPCPLQVINECEWTGQMKDVIDHCKDTHPNNIFFKESQKLTCPNFIGNSITSTSYFHILFNVHGEIFKCVWDVNFDTGYMRWCVYILNKPQNPLGFDFEIEFTKSSSPSDTIKLRARCPLLKDEDDQLNNGHHMITHYDMIKDCCKNGDLLYTVTIIKREDFD